jgi:polar amino acid transport system substrate-binding protein
MSRNIFSAKNPFLGVLLILALLAIAWQFGCRMDTRQIEKKEPGRIDEIRKVGKIIVGTSADYPPYEFRLLPDLEDEIVGIDIDIAEAIAADLNVKLEIKNVVFHRLFDELTAGNIDLILAGLAPTQDRQQIVDFSIPYYQAVQNMLIRTSDRDKIKLVEDLRGKTIGTQTGSIQDDMARNSIIGATFVTMPTVQKLIAALMRKELDAVILEKPVAAAYVFNNSELLNLECNSDRTPLGSAVAVRKGDAELLDRINRILGNLIKENRISQFVEDAKVFTEKI